jgi:hypothetical protein
MGKQILSSKLPIQFVPQQIGIVTQREYSVQQDIWKTWFGGRTVNAFAAVDQSNGEHLGFAYHLLFQSELSTSLLREEWVVTHLETGQRLPNFTVGSAGQAEAWIQAFLCIGERAGFPLPFWKQDLSRLAREQRLRLLKIVEQAWREAVRPPLRLTCIHMARGK